MGLFPIFVEPAFHFKPARPSAAGGHTEQRQLIRECAGSTASPSAAPISVSTKAEPLSMTDKVPKLLFDALGSIAGNWLLICATALFTATTR